MKSSSLWAPRVPFTAKFPNGEITGHFNPMLLAASYMDGKSIPEFLAGGIVLDWDFETEEGAPFPFDAERLAKEPDWVIAGLWDAVMEKRRPNPLNSGTTAAG